MPELNTDDIDEELGVKEEYADELRERMNDPDGPIAPSLFEGAFQAIQSNPPSGEDKSTRWVALLVGAMMEGARATRREADKLSDNSQSVRQTAMSLYQERMTQRALDGTLFDALEEEHPGTFEEILTERFPEWAAQKAYAHVQQLKES